MWDIQVLVYWQHEGQTKTPTDVSRLLGSRLRVFSIEVEDIYFITGLSQQGEVVNLLSQGLGGGLTIDEYIVIYYFSDTKKVGIQILTNSIQVLGLKAILLALGRIAGLASLH